jgi:hypothetical protein
VGLGTTALGWTLCATLLVGALVWAVYKRPWQSTSGLELQAGEIAPKPEPLE